MDLYLKNSTSMPVKLIMLAMILLTGLSSLAQDFQDAMRSLPEDPAKEFARPLTDAFGADINTGWLSNAPSATILGFDFRIGLVAMGWALLLIKMPKFLYC
jgi:hypothetical protein